MKKGEPSYLQLACLYFPPFGILVIRTHTHTPSVLKKSIILFILVLGQTEYIYSRGIVFFSLSFKYSGADDLILFFLIAV